MRRDNFDTGSQPVRNVIKNPNMSSATGGTDVILTNWFQNPDFEGTTVQFGNIGGGPASFTTSGITTDNPHSGTRSFKFGNCYAAGQLGHGLYLPTQGVMIPKGATISWSYWIYSSRAGSVIPYTEGNKVSDNSYMGGNGTIPGVSYTVPANTWTYIQGSWLNTVADYYPARVGGYQLQVQVGDNVWLDDFCCTTSANPVPCFTGNTPSVNGYTYAWTGAANSSASVMKATASIYRTNYCKYPNFEGTQGALAPFRTNLATNPGMEASSATTVVAQNLATNPSVENGSTNWNVWGGAGGNTTSTVVTGAGDAYSGGAYWRTQWTTASTAVQGGSYYSHPTVTAGTVYSASMSVRCSKAQTIALNIEWFDASNNKLATSPGGYNNLTPNTWTRISISAITAPASATRAQITAYASTGGSLWQVGDVLDTDAVLFEASGIVNPYFDGTTAAGGGFTYAWAATANASTSYKIAPTVTSWTPQWYGSSGGTGVSYQSAGTGMNGGASYRKLWKTANTAAAMDTGVTTTIPVTAGTAYTASIYVNPSVAQTSSPYVSWKDSTGAQISSTSLPNISTPANTWTRVSTTATAPSGAVNGQFVFGPYNGAQAMPAGATMDYDQCLIEASSVLNSYFDGSTAASGNINYGWTGTINASSSQASGRPYSGTWTSTRGSTVVTSSTSQFGTYSGMLYVNQVGYFPRLNEVNTANVPTTSPGDVWTVSVYGMSTTANIRLGVFPIDTTNGNVGVGPSFETTVASNGAWVRASVTLTIPTGANSFWVYAGVPDNSPIGTIAYFDNFIWEKSSVLGAYFDGSVGQDVDLPVRWAAGANGSASQMYGIAAYSYVNEANVSSWLKSTGELRVVNYRGTTNSLQTPQVLTVGKTYTLMLQARSYNGGSTVVFGSNNNNATPAFAFTPNYAWYTATFLATQDRLYFSTQGGANKGFDIKNMLIVEGNYTGRYFSGDSPQAKWESNSNASASLGYPSV